MFRLVLLSILSIGYSNPVDSSNERFLFAPDIQELAKKVFEECDSKFGPIPNIYETMREGKCSDDENFKKFIHCVYRTAGYSYDDGRVNVEKTAALYPEESNVFPVMKACDNEFKAGAVENTFQFFKCFQRDTPQKMGL